MKRAIVIILVILLVAGGGAGGLMMMGIVPNPFNPGSLGAGLTDADRAAQELAARKFQPPSSALKLVKVDDMILPVFIDGQVYRRVFVIARLVVSSPEYESRVKDTLRIYQNAVLQDLIPYLQKYYLDHNAISAAVIKERLSTIANKVYGEMVNDVLLINVFDQSSGR